LGKRRRSRELALQVLYQRDITGQDAAKTLILFQEHFSPDQERDEFAERIVLGVLTQREEIDRLIEQYSDNWRLDRMTVIDRNLLRLATFELLYCDEIPPKVTLNEAIDLGKKFGSEESSAFINGILDRIQKEAVRKTVSSN
jgi:transcription antitermination protein NusB